MGENIAVWALNLVYIINKHFLTNLAAKVFFDVFNFFDQKLFFWKFHVFLDLFRPVFKNFVFTLKTITYMYILNVSLQVPFVTYIVLDDTF